MSLILQGYGGGRAHDTLNMELANVECPIKILPYSGIEFKLVALHANGKQRACSMEVTLSENSTMILIGALLADIQRKRAQERSAIDMECRSMFVDLLMGSNILNRRADRIISITCDEFRSYRPLYKIMKENNILSMRNFMEIIYDHEGNLFKGIKDRDHLPKLLGKWLQDLMGLDPDSRFTVLCEQTFNINSAVGREIKTRLGEMTLADFLEMRTVPIIVEPPPA